MSVAGGVLVIHIDLFEDTWGLKVCQYQLRKQQPDNADAWCREMAVFATSDFTAALARFDTQFQARGQLGGSDHPAS